MNLRGLYIHPNARVCGFHLPYLIAEWHEIIKLAGVDDKASDEPTIKQVVYLLFRQLWCAKSALLKCWQVLVKPSLELWESIHKPLLCLAWV